MSRYCKSCGRVIRVMAFRGTDWCSDDCRKILLGKVKCEYTTMWDDVVGEIDVCIVHSNHSKYGPERGPHRPCLSVEPY